MSAAGITEGNVPQTSRTCGKYRARAEKTANKDSDPRGEQFANSYSPWPHSPPRFPTEASILPSFNIASVGVNFVRVNTTKHTGACGRKGTRDLKVKCLNSASIEIG